MSAAVLTPRPVLNRARHNSHEPVDPGLTTPEMPVFTTRLNVELTSRNRPSPKQAWRTFAGLTAAIVVLAASAMTQPWTEHPSKSVAAASQSAASLRTVTIDRPMPAAVASVVLPATIRPWQTTMLYARVSGYLVAWHRDLGTQVKA